MQKKHFGNTKKSFKTTKENSDFEFKQKQSTLDNSDSNNIPISKHELNILSVNFFICAIVIGFLGYFSYKNYMFLINFIAIRIIMEYFAYSNIRKAFKLKNSYNCLNYLSKAMKLTLDYDKVNYAKHYFNYKATTSINLVKIIYILITLYIAKVVPRLISLGMLVAVVYFFYKTFINHKERIYG